MQCTILGSFLQSWATVDHLERGHLGEGDGPGPAVRQAPPAGEQSSREGRFLGGGGGGGEGGGGVSGGGGGGAHLVRYLPTTEVICSPDLPSRFGEGVIILERNSF